MNTTVTTSTPQTPEHIGQWSSQFNWPLIPLHAALLHTGEVIGWEYNLAGGPYLWNPVTNQFTAVTMTTTNMFCAGLGALPDGRLLSVGGHTDTHVGTKTVYVFDPLTRAWSAAPNMTYGRWYPTVTGLPDGRSLITAGEINCNECNALIPEIYDPLTNQLSLLSSASHNFGYYPHMYVLPNGGVFAAATAKYAITSQLLNPSTLTWSAVDTATVDGGSSVMYLPGKIMKSGTSHDPDLPPDPSSNRTYTIDMTAPSPHWTETAPMAFPRTYHTLTSLPDGNVLVTGGGLTTNPTDSAIAVLPAEMWSPSTQTYTTLASLHAARLYHSIAILLPDARVLVAGGGRFFGYPSSDPSDRANAEIYSPPYLFKGPRPSISTAPQEGVYDSSINVGTPNAASIASVSLIKLATVTHAFNIDQRYLPLQFTASGNALTVQLPANANLAPPGYYMLFIVDSNGVPSTGSMIRIHQ
jgi:hypothetical protein